MHVQRRVCWAVGVFFLGLAWSLALAAQEARWKQLSAQVEQLYKQGKYAEALPVAKEALRAAESTFGPNHPNTATALDELGKIYVLQHKYAEAETLLRQALAIDEQVQGPEHAAGARDLNSLAELYQRQGKYGEAEPLYQRSLAIREKALGPDHPDVAASLNNLANLYSNQGKHGEAEPLYQRSLAIREKTLGPDHPDVAASLNNLANLYSNQGKYREAEPLYQRSLTIREKALGPDRPEVAGSLNNLANLYSNQGKYGEAEPLYQRSLAIKEKALGPDHPDVANGLNNLANLYRAQGKYGEAEPLYQRSLAIREKALGPDHPDVATSLNNLAELYWAQGKYREAEPLYQRSLAIREKALGPDHPDVASGLNNLAELYWAQGKYREAEPLYQRSLAIREKALGPDHPDVATGLNNLAELYWAQGRYRGAEPLYRRSLAIYEKALGPAHPDVAESLKNLAMLFYAQGKYAEAGAFFNRGLGTLSRQFQYGFRYMSEKDRLAFLDKVSKVFPIYFSFCLSNRDRDPDLTGKMYDVLLWQKGLVANSITGLRTQIAASGDKESISLFERLRAKRAQLAALSAAQSEDREKWRKTVDQLEQESNRLEQQLVRRSSALAEDKRLAQASWRDVQKALGKDEAVVELVRFRFHDGKKWTDTSYYAALVVTPQTTAAPTLVLLGDAAKLEGQPLRMYRNWVSGLGFAPGVAPYQAFWRPLERALGGSKRIYLSPDGVLNQMSLGLIPSPSGHLLMEKYDLRIVSSTRDLLRKRSVLPTNTAVLIGNPRFDLSEVEQRAAMTRLQNRIRRESEPLLAWAGNGLRSRDQGAERLLPLPATKVELELVRSVLEKHNWKVELYSEEDALADTVRRVQGPRILHLATHGFFLSDPDRGNRGLLSNLPSGAEDPMLRSGLFFAGANRTLSGAVPTADLGDGMLTAYEVTGLNLQGTELVVLSACETGLGEVKNGEGVFGLRRALQEAGAEAVLMSLWAVPDRETQELMTLFYKHWLSGQEKHLALREAQLELRKRVKTQYGQDKPFYWGGFVLVGS